MRLIVVGSTKTADDGTVTGEVFFRYQVPAGREHIYASSSASPQAPGLYGSGQKHASEIDDLQAGRYVEARIDSPQKMVKAQGTPAMESQLAGLYALEQAAWAKRENDRLQYYGWSYDGGAWDESGIA